MEYENHSSPSIYVKFEVSNPEVLDLKGSKKLYLLIWTTTPWTLLANVAVSVHPDYRYSLVDTGKEILVIENSLVNSVLLKAGVKDFTTIKEVSGKELTALHYKHPFVILKDCRVVLADYVTKEEGTGLVHTAPGHGLDDYKIGLAYNLEVLMPVDDRGIYTAQAQRYAKEHVFKANKHIIADLKERGDLCSMRTSCILIPIAGAARSRLSFARLNSGF